MKRWLRPVVYGLLGAFVAAVFSAAAFALVGDSLGTPAQDVLLPTSASQDASRSPDDDDRSQSDSPSPSPSESPSESGDDHGGDSGNSGPGGGGDDSGGWGSTGPR